MDDNDRISPAAVWRYLAALGIIAFLALFAVLFVNGQDQAETKARREVGELGR